MEKLFNYIQRELNLARRCESTQGKESAYDRAFGALMFYTELYPETCDTLAKIWVDEYRPIFEQILYEK